MHRLVLPTVYLALVADGIPAVVEARSCIDALLAGMCVRLVGEAVARFTFGVDTRGSQGSHAALLVALGCELVDGGLNLRRNRLFLGVALGLRSLLLSLDTASQVSHLNPGLGRALRIDDAPQLFVRLLFESHAHSRGSVSVLHVLAICDAHHEVATEPELT